MPLKNVDIYLSKAAAAKAREIPITLPLTQIASSLVGANRKVSALPAHQSKIATDIGSEAFHRRHSSVFGRRGTTSLHLQSGSFLGELGERTSSKLTLDEELYDILYAFGEADILCERDEEEDDDEKKSEKPLTRQSLLNKIRQKKEVINKLRCQPWSMNRKRRTLRLAQKYLEQNESKVSRAHLYKEELTKRWKLFLRWASNISIYLIPWESKIKKIESQFGSVVSSYFTFLRWVIFMNLMITLLIASIIIIPEFLADATANEIRRNKTDTRKQVPFEERKQADEFQVVWHYGGYVRYSPLFYGYYANMNFVVDWFRYPIPLAYFLGTIIVFACSFMAILRKMAFNARMSKLAGSKTEQYIFNWKVFTGWDFTIGNAETASNTAMAAAIKLRETINECHAEQSKRIRPIQVLIRIFTNLIILGMIAFSIYCIHAAVQSSETMDQTGSGSLLNKNEVPSVVSTITHVFPIIFDVIGRIEKHHPKMQLRLHLIRVLTLYVINYATLIFALFEKLDNIRDSTRTFDDDDRKYYASSSSRETRHSPNYRPVHKPKFFSRNFSSEEQFQKFLYQTFVATSAAVKPEKNKNRRNETVRPKNTEKSVAAMSTPDVSTTSTQKIKLKRQTVDELNLNALLSLSTLAHNWRPTSPPIKDLTRQKDVTVNGSLVTINAQFGPLGVNNPTVLMRNATALPSLTSYETRRLGPTLLPIFTPPPLPPTEATQTFRKHDFGGIGWDSSKKDNTEESLIMFGDVVNLDTIPYIDMNGDAVSELNGTSVAEISSEYGDQGHYNDHICWETVIGQEIVKLVTVDLYYTIISILLIDFLRGYWIRYCSSWWLCWDIETTFPEYGEFKVAENVLHIINNQGMVWLGLFFAPLLPAINNIKLIVILYIRAWACMTCNVPAREIFRASRSSNFFLMILLLWLLLCTLPVGYVITSKRPSTICGPFSGREQFYEVITEIIEAHVSKKVLRWLKYVASPGVIIPIILLLLLIIFFLVSLVRGLREANTDLQKQLVHERTEEKKKIFELAGRGNKNKTSSSFFGLLSKSQPKKPVHYLPEIEQKRREPWRQHNGTNKASSLCLSDELPSSLNSPYLKDNISPGITARLDQTKRLANLNLKENHSTNDVITMAELSVPPQKIFRSSLGLVNKGDNILGNSSTPDNYLKENVKYDQNMRIMPESVSGKVTKSVSITRNIQIDRPENCCLTENEANQSENSYDTQSTSNLDTNENYNKQAQLHTPDDLQLHQLAGYPVAVTALQVRGSNSPVMSMLQSGTNQSEVCNLVDNGSAGTHLFAYKPKHDMMVKLPANPVPATEVQQRISIYAKEPRRLGQISVQQMSLSGARINTSVNVHLQPAQQRTAKPKPVAKNLTPVRLKKNTNVEKLQQQSTSSPISPSTSSQKARKTLVKPQKTPPSPTKKFLANDLTNQFVPWPSMEELKAQRTQLYPTSQPIKQPLSTSSQISSSLSYHVRSRSPPKMLICSPNSLKKEILKPSTSSAFSDAKNHEAIQPARFRIAVSPTRKIQSGSDSETEKPLQHSRLKHNKSRYLIKQQLMPGSTSSFGSRFSTETAAVRAELAASRIAAAKNKIAPKVEFGDDDSPRVEFPPKIN